MTGVMTGVREGLQEGVYHVDSLDVMSSLSMLIGSHTYSHTRLLPIGAK